MNVLAIEPYHGGSHHAFLTGWTRHSRHHFTILHLPPRKWKWRMRHAAITCADQARQALANHAHWDALFCSDMLNLAEFKGLAPRPVRDLPTIAYFHENQLTYPFRYAGERDYHFGFTNMTTALAADQVWFNSAFHRNDFLSALTSALKRMPDFRPLSAIDTIRNKSHIHPPGIDLPPPPAPRPAGPLHIAWAARWEHDKNPEDFFAALRKLKNTQIPFRLSVLGQQFDDAPEIFTNAHAEFRTHIAHWGYLPTRQTYLDALNQAHVFVSTADHEFFGLSAIEALAAGCYPLLPNRLAYPEVLALHQNPHAQQHFYDGTPTALADRLTSLAHQLHENGNIWNNDPHFGRRRAQQHSWEIRAPQMDQALEDLAAGLTAD